MVANTRKFIRFCSLLAMIVVVAGRPIILPKPLRAENCTGEIEFRLAERADTRFPKITDFITEEYRGVQYRIAESAELRLRRAALTAVVVQELEPGNYGLILEIDRSLWNKIESITTAHQRSRLAIYVDGSLIIVATVATPIPTGSLTILYGHSKEEVFEIARRFSRTPRFLPFESTEMR
ncbi:MAG: hypothetical protein ACE5NA_13420 [Nitrospiraceae bacterium]